MPIQAQPEQWVIICRILQAHVPDREVRAFGSRATGTAKPYSDLDLVVLGDPSIGLDRLAALTEAFSESDLPWKVDIVDGALADPDFLRRIQSQSVVVQQADR
ncbi:MAG: nucleotidyltransferase domain-containing protein [Wenzhouxiangellaceae bacterium]|nr:nucleotidyltransferase domain-containing protein [Wenzhouxiangellaceae bacterium]